MKNASKYVIVTNSIIIVSKKVFDQIVEDPETATVDVDGYYTVFKPYYTGQKVSVISARNCSEIIKAIDGLEKPEMVKTYGSIIFDALWHIMRYSIALEAVYGNKPFYEAFYLECLKWSQYNGPDREKWLRAFHKALEPFIIAAQSAVHDEEIEI